MKPFHASGYCAALWCCFGIGLLWGSGEALTASYLGCKDPLAIFLFYPLVVFVLGIAVQVLLVRLPAEKAVPLLAGALVTIAAAEPLAVWINLTYIHNVPLVSMTNALIVLGSLIAGLIPGAVAWWLARPLYRFFMKHYSARRSILYWILPSAFFCFCAWWTAQVFMPPDPGPWRDNRKRVGDKPNVVLIVIDTLRADHLSCYGYPRNTTPFLDALPAARFERAYAQGHWTLPSTASLLTGLYPATHKTNHLDSVLPKSTLTLTQILNVYGYVTGYFTGNFAVSSVFGFTRGADYVISELRLPQFRLYPSSIGCVLRRKMGNLAHGDKLNRWIFPYLESVKDRRFFLYIHYKDPHQPYTPPSPFDDTYDPEFGGRRIIDPSMRDQWPISERERTNMVARYDGEIRFLDEQIGRIFQALDRLNLRESTLVIVTSDHGEEFEDHGGWLHGQTVYEEMIRVPLLVSYPPFDLAGRVVEEPVCLVDVLPTVLELLDLPVTEGLQGKSLLPILKGSTDPAARSVFSEGTATGHAAYLRGPYKLIREKLKGKETYTLFRLDTDPEEKEDLAAKHPEIVEALRKEMEAAEESYEAVSVKEEKKRLDAADIEQLRDLGYIK